MLLTCIILELFISEFRKALTEIINCLLTHLNSDGGSCVSSLLSVGATQRSDNNKLICYSLT